MLCVCFHVQQQIYAIRTSNVIRVLPRVEAKRLPHAPAWFCGIVRVLGEGVPLVDFCQLATGQSSRLLYSTRMILLRCLDDRQQARSLALLAEGVTGTVQFREDSVHRLAMHLAQAPWLAEVLSDERGTVQLIDVNQLYSDELAQLLGQQTRV